LTPNVEDTPLSINTSRINKPKFLIASDGNLYPYFFLVHFKALAIIIIMGHFSQEKRQYYLSGIIQV